MALKQAMTPTTEKRWFLIGLAVVGLAVAGVHWPVLSAQAISFDDSIYLFENPAFRQPGWESLRQFFDEVLHSPTVEGYYEPLTLTSLMFDVMAGGRPDHLQPFHRTSLALHVANTILIVVLLYCLFGEPWAALMTGLLFGLHPLTVEPVSWVWERKTLLATFFALLSIISYVRYAGVNPKSKISSSLSLRAEGRTHPPIPPLTKSRTRRGEGGPKLIPPLTKGGLGGVWYALCIFCFVLAVLSKPTSMPLPLMLLLLDGWPLNRFSRRAIIEKIPFFAIAALSAIVTIISTKQNVGIMLPSALEPAHILGRICYLLMFYLRKIVWPVNLSSSYAPPASFSLTQPAVLAGVVGVALLAIALAISMRRTRAYFTSFIIFLLAISPTLGIVGYSWVIASDKYVYLPAVGLLLALCFAIARLWSMQRVATVVCVLLLAGAEAVGTRQYLGQWKDTETFSEYMLRLNPDAPAVLNQLGNVRSRQGRSDEAIKLYRRALEAEPRLYSAHYNLGLELAMRGRTNEAVDCFKKALQLKPTFAKAHANLAVMLIGQGQIENAAAHLKQALQLEPSSPRTHNNLANILAQHGQAAEAEKHYREALRLNPDYAEAHSHLAVVLAERGNLREAQEHYEAALRIQPRFAEGHNNFALFLVQAGRVEDAIGHYLTAIQIRPHYVDARMNLARALQANGRSAEAAEQYRQVLQIQPQRQEAKALLGQLTLASQPQTEPRLDN